MATKKQSAKKTTTKNKAPVAKKKTATKKTATRVIKKSASLVPSPITPALAVLAAVFTYISFSLAIDSGSFWHYGFGFYFSFQTARLTKLSIKSRLDDKARRAPKA